MNREPSKRRSGRFDRGESNFIKFWGHSKKRVGGSAYLDRPAKDDGGNDGEEPTMMLDAAAIKDLYKSSDLKGLQTACDEVGMAALDSFEQASTTFVLNSETRDMVQLALMLQTRILEVVVNEQHSFAANTYKISNLHRRVALLWLLLDCSDSSGANGVQRSGRWSNQNSMDANKALKHLEHATKLSGDHDRHMGLHAVETIFLRHLASLVRGGPALRPSRSTAVRTVDISSLDHTMLTETGSTDDEEEDDGSKPKNALVPTFFSSSRLRKPEAYGVLSLGFALGFLLALLAVYGLHAASGYAATTKNAPRTMLSHSHHLGTIHSRRFGGYKKASHYHSHSPPGQHSSPTPRSA